MRVAFARLKRPREDGEVECKGDINKLTRHIWEYMFKRGFLEFGHAVILSCLSRHLRYIMMQCVTYAPCLEKFLDCQARFMESTCQRCEKGEYPLVPAAWNWHANRNPVPICSDCFDKSEGQSVSNDTFRALKSDYEVPSHWKWELQSMFDVHPVVFKAFLKQVILPVEMPICGSALDHVAALVTKVLSTKPLKHDARRVLHSILHETPLVPIAIAKHAY